MKGSPRIAGVALAAIASASVANAQFPEGKVSDYTLITAGSGGFGGALFVGDQFGASTAGIGDLDGNGVPDIIAGAPGDDDGGSNRGSAWVIFLNANGRAIDEQRISDTAGGFGGTLANANAFGTAVANVGDLNGDRQNEVAVGTVDNRFFILFLNTDGTVASEVEIGAGLGGFGGALTAGDGFGSALTSVGDINGDGTPDIVAGAPGEDDGGTNRGGAWVLFMNTDGTVASEQKISSTTGGLGTGLSNGDAFGSSVAGMSDLDGNGVNEVVVGAPLTDGTDLISPGLGQPPIPVASSNEGVAFVLFLDTDGTVLSKVEIGEGKGGFTAQPKSGDNFGAHVAALGDINGNGTTDISIGAPNRATNVGPYGGFYQTFLEDDGTVQRNQLVSQGVGGLSCGFQCLVIFPGDAFASVGSIGDIDGDCIEDMVCGVPGYPQGQNGGGVFTLILNGDTQAQSEFRNGSGANTDAYTAGRPRLGKDWDALIDTSAYAGTATLTLIIGVAAPVAGFPSPFGEILVDLGSAEVIGDVVIGDTGVHSLAIPNSLVLLGLPVATQAGIGGSAGVELVNAIDIKVGY